MSRYATSQKILRASYLWPSLFKDCITVVHKILELLHTHLGFIFPKVFICLLVIISHYPISYILGENIPPGEYFLSVNTSIELSLDVALVLSPWKIGMITMQMRNFLGTITRLAYYP